MRKCYLFISPLILSLIFCTGAIAQKPSTKSILSVDEARSYYQTIINADKRRKLLFWDNAIQKKISETESVVTVPFMFRHPESVVMEDSRYPVARDSLESSGVRPFLIFSKKSGVLNAAFLYIIEDEPFYFKKKALINQANFQGYAFLVTLDEEFIECAIFEEGKELFVTKSTLLNPKKAKNLSLCITYHKYSGSYKLFGANEPMFENKVTSCQKHFYTGNSTTSSYVSNLALTVLSGRLSVTFDGMAEFFQLD